MYVSLSGWWARRCEFMMITRAGYFLGGQERMLYPHVSDLALST